MVSPNELPLANGDEGPGQVSRGAWSLDVDKPADPATPFDEVYQSFFADLALEGRSLDA